MGATFREAGLEEIARSAEVRDLVAGAAGQVRDAAKSDAPVLTGEYRDSIHVELEQTPDGHVATVVADVEYAMVIESREGVLARAVGKVASRV